MPPHAEYLRYPDIDRPGPGDLIEIIPGVSWLRMPLPFMLNHINLWLLDDGDDVAIVDTGLPSKETHALWRGHLGDRPGTRNVSRVIVTHMHPDHTGNAGWLCKHYDAPLFMSRAEYLMCRVLAANTGKPAPAAGIDFYRGAGFDDDAMARYEKNFGGFGRAVYPMPDSFHRLQDRQLLTIGENEWRVITTSGHCPEHASLYCAEKNILIAGDQLLPTISSNVSVWPTEPDADPLGFWLDSCRKLLVEVPEDVLVLPAHGKPFRGGHDRLRALIAEHEEGLDKLLVLCAEPQRAVDTFSALFRSRITDSNLIMATGEALAHLNYLLLRGKLTTTRDDDGVLWYSSSDA